MLRQDKLISALEPDIFKKLINALDRDFAWKKVVDFLRNEHMFDDDFEFSASLQGTKGRILLIELAIRLMCTIEHLSFILRKCKLYDVLSIICPEPMQIQKEPTENLRDNILSVKREQNLLLEFIVFGLPLPNYCWYRNGLALLDQNKSKLYYEHFLLEMKGEYYCIATQNQNDGEIKILQSKTVYVETLIERCVVLKKPLPEICKIEGESIIFKVKVNGYPAPKYEWTHNNTVLKNFTENEFFKAKCGTEDSGTYRCRISNCANEIIVQTNLIVYDSGYLFPIVREPAVEKIALLIGNQQYENLSMLNAPNNDVEALASLLESMQFIVIKAKNLKLSEMKEKLAYFCKMLVKEAYVLVYFAGHGFELGEKYLLPTDAPDPKKYGFKDCICECQILRDVLNTKPKLFLLLLDMCLELPDRLINSAIYEEKKEIFDYEPDRNLIQAYATSSRLSSYEIGHKSKEYNSIYNTALLKYMGENLTIFKILAKVNIYIENLNKNVTTIKQIPSININVARDFYLNVPKTGHPKTLEIYTNMMEK